MKGKENRIENLTISKLSDLFFDILNSEGYKELTKKSPFVLTGQTFEGISKTTTMFFIYQQVLSGGDVKIKELCNKLKLAYKNVNPDKVHLISGFSLSSSVEAQLKRELGFNIEFLTKGNIELIVKKHFPNLWIYESLDLVNYEKFFLNEMVEKSSLLSIQGMEEKASKILDVYVKPRIYEVKNDLESNSSQFHRVHEIEIINSGKNGVIEGDTGSGKSTILRELGRLQIQNQQKLKTLPIFISPIHLHNENYDVKNTIISLIKGRVNGSWQELLTSYKFLLLVDNIDEFERNEQVSILTQLESFASSYKIQYVLTTRSIKSGRLSSFYKDLNVYQIRKFNDNQIKEFTTRFFKNEVIAQNLIEALEENRILERLPLTPLSLSLISLVYDKEDYEIPATISDIYDNFNQLILGKLTATKKFDLINFNFKERILSIYALEILNKNKGRPYKKEQFVKFIEDHFKDKSSKVEKTVILEFLEYFIDNSGILKIEEEEYVNFSHKSFLEYYASLEVFKHNRNKEETLIENFLDLNWQNVGIFYAGQSNDMPAFLRKVLNRVQKSSLLDEHNNAILGLGYLLQALYQTDNKLREEAILEALNQNLIVHDWYKKKVSDGDILLFKNMKFPTLSIINMYYFYLNFLSSTLSEPLDMAFNTLLKRYKVEKTTSLGYKLLTIAAIFHSHRIGDSSYLIRLLDERSFLKDPYLVTVGSFALYFDKSSEHKEMKQQIKVAYDKLQKVTKSLIETPANRLRFSNLDTIESDKKVVIITEGPTDAEIIEHAYTIISNGKIPYWKIKPAGIVSGGAKEVKFTLDKSKPLADEGIIVIGIFDHDTEGLNQFDGLKYRYFGDFLRVKKMDDTSVYGLKLPIPTYRTHYAQQERENHYMAIEHYFDDELLKKFDLVKEAGVEGLLKIKDTKSLKRNFSKYIKSLTEPRFFENFIPLFETIDIISNVQDFDYHENI